MGFDITSPANERVKWLVRLRDRRHRDAEGLFVVEGRRLYERALAAGLKPIVTFVSDPGIAVSVGDKISVSPEVLDKASYRPRAQGLISVFEQYGDSPDHLEIEGAPLLLIAEDVEKPGNLGAMCRTASAAGAHAVFTVGDTVDRWNPNALRSSTGAIFSLPVVATQWDEIGPWLADRGVMVVAATPHASDPVWGVDLTGPVALVIGAEDAGLSERARAIADEVVAIPQDGRGVDSLNASVAAAVVLFEAVRQRAYGGG